MSVGQFEVVSKAAPTSGQTVGKVAFFDANGDPVDVGGGGAGAVESVNGKTGAVVLNAADVGAAATSHNQAATTVTVAAATGIVGANVQLVLADLAARVVALEAGTP